MYYFWGYIKLENKGEEGLSVAMLSTIDPNKNKSLPFKKWRFSLRAFENPSDAMSWGRRLVSRYAQLKAVEHRLHSDAAKSSANNEPFKYVSVSGKQKSKPRRAGKA